MAEAKKRKVFFLKKESINFIKERKGGKMRESFVEILNIVESNIEKINWKKISKIIEEKIKEKKERKKIIKGSSIDIKKKEEALFNRVKGHILKNTIIKGVDILTSDLVHEATITIFKTITDKENEI